MIVKSPQRQAMPGSSVPDGVVRRRRCNTWPSAVEAGPGDYVLLDGTLPHDAEAIGDEPARLVIVYPRGGHSELTRRDG